MDRYQRPGRVAASAFLAFLIVRVDVSIARRPDIHPRCGSWYVDRMAAHQADPSALMVLSMGAWRRDDGTTNGAAEMASKLVVSSSVLLECAHGLCEPLIFDWCDFFCFGSLPPCSGAATTPRSRRLRCLWSGGQRRFRPAARHAHVLVVC